MELKQETQGLTEAFSSLELYHHSPVDIYGTEWFLPFHFIRFVKQLMRQPVLIRQTVDLIRLRRRQLKKNWLRQ